MKLSLLLIKKLIHSMNQLLRVVLALPEICFVVLPPDILIVPLSSPSGCFFVCKSICRVSFLIADIKPGNILPLHRALKIRLVNLSSDCHPMWRVLKFNNL